MDKMGPIISGLKSQNSQSLLYDCETRLFVHLRWLLMDCGIIMGSEAPGEAGKEQRQARVLEACSLACALLPTCCLTYQAPFMCKHSPASMLHQCEMDFRTWKSAPKRGLQGNKCPTWPACSQKQHQEKQRDGQQCWMKTLTNVMACESRLSPKSLCTYQGSNSYQLLGNKQA